MNKRRKIAFCLVIAIVISLTATLHSAWANLQAFNRRLVLDADLSRAVSELDVSAVTELLNSGADPDPPARPSAKYRTIIEAVKDMLPPFHHEVTTPVTRTSLLLQICEEYELLHAPSDAGRAPSDATRDVYDQIIVQLIHHGAKTNILIDVDALEGDHTPRQPLYKLAVMENFEGTVSLLLKSGQPVDARFDGGETALMLSKSGPMTSLLLRNGANPHLRDDSESTPLLCAAYVGLDESSDRIKLLMDAGAALDVQNDNGQTALMWANSTSSARTLLSRGASIAITDHNGCSVIEALKMRKRAAGSEDGEGSVEGFKQAIEVVRAAQRKARSK